MAILATYTPAALVDVVAGDDVGALRMISGVGPEDRRSACWSS